MLQAMLLLKIDHSVHSVVVTKLWRHQQKQAASPATQKVVYSDAQMTLFWSSDHCKCHFEFSEADFFLKWTNKGLQYYWDESRWETRMISAKYVGVDSPACFVASDLCEQCPVICTSLKIGFVHLLSAVLNKWRSSLSDTIADEKTYHLMFEWVWSN